MSTDTDPSWRDYTDRDAHQALLAADLAAELADPDTPW
jgi:hypothetical protein